MQVVRHGREGGYADGPGAAGGELVGPFVAGAEGGVGVDFGGKGGVGDVEFVGVDAVILLLSLSI